MEQRLLVGVLGQVDGEALDRLRGAHELNEYTDTRELSPDLDLLVVRSPFEVTEAVLEAVPRLRWIVRAGSGTDNIDLVACRARSVEVYTTPDGGNGVAELALGLLLSVARSIPTLDRKVARGEWPKWSTRGAELGGRSLGVIGYGAIGRKVARLARALDMRVLATNGPRRPDDADDEVVDLPTLLDRSWAVVVCCPLSPGTRGLLGDDELSRGPRGGILVNVARGGIVQESALLRALKSGRLAGAGLDVVVGEPVISQELRDHPRIVLTPHVGAQTVEAHARIGLAVEAVVRQIARGFP